MPYRDLLQTDQFRQALLTKLSRNQAVRLLSALASIGKDADALSGHDWVEVTSLAGGPENTMRLVIRDENDQCWSAFVVFDGTHDVLVMLYASAGQSVTEADMQEIQQAYQDSVWYLESRESGS